MCAHGLVRTEGGGGSTMIRCGFMPAYFPVLVVLPHMAHHLSGHSDW